MSYEDIIKIAKEKARKEKEEARQKEIAAREEIKNAKKKAILRAQNEKKEKLERENRRREAEKALVERANEVLFDMINGGKAPSKKDESLVHLDDGNVVGVHNGEIFYTMQEGKKSYLVLTKATKTTVNDGDHYPTFSDSTYFSSDRVEIARNGAKNPEVNYSNFYSFTYNDYYGKNDNCFKDFEERALNHLPKEFVKNLFDYSKKNVK